MRVLVVEDEVGLADTIRDGLTGAGFTVAVCLALGSLLIGRLRITLYRGEAALFGFVSGAAGLS